MYFFQHFTVALLASTVSAVPAYIESRATTSTLAITGAYKGGVQPRLEIRDLQQNADQWNIYLLALRAFQNRDGSDPISWYQIAGIHGMPFVSWDGSEQCASCAPNGYCTHSSTLFLNWHRAYMGLFEQALQKNAIAMAKKFPRAQRKRWIAAAQTLRMPYWDWGMKLAAGEAPFPTIFTETTVSVTTPRGQKTIANPLYSYTFGNEDHSFMATSKTQDTGSTYRDVKINTQTQGQIREDLWTVLTASQDWADFGTQAVVKVGRNSVPHSLEMVHDNVHTKVGGDMAYIPVSSYDPIFFLHHGMVDRAYALWQLAYPDQWVTAFQQTHGTYTIAKNSVEDAQSPLTPFHSDSVGTYYNSDDLRDTTTLGYVYADIASGESAAEIINNLYADDSSSASKRSEGSNTVTKYSATVTVDSLAMDGSFTLYLFDGEVSDDNTASWDESDSLLSTHGFFSGPQMDSDGTSLVNAGISLTPALKERVAEGKLNSMSKDDVTEYLKDNLEWKVKSIDGTVVPASEVPKLQVAITAADVEMPAAKDKMPVWGDVETLPTITQDKPAGARD